MIDDQVFKLLMQRFDKIDEDNKEINTALKEHLKESDEVNKVVAKHTTYWSLFTYIVCAIFVAVAGTAAASFIK